MNSRDETRFYGGFIPPETSVAIQVVFTEGNGVSMVLIGNGFRVEWTETSKESVEVDCDGSPGGCRPLRRPHSRLHTTSYKLLVERRLFSGEN